MINFKQETRQACERMEQCDIFQLMRTGTLSPYIYSVYLYNLHKRLEPLESYAEAWSIFSKTPGLQRSKRVLSDFKSRWDNSQVRPPMLAATEAYIQHLAKIKQQANLLCAHVYVLNLDIMRYGVELKKVIPGVNKTYEYTLKEYGYFEPAMKIKLNEYLADEKEQTLAEARLCYQFNKDIFDELSLIEEETHIS